MFLEGVPPAISKTLAKMAGMTVGPALAVDEVALDLGLKIMKATEADLGPNAIDQGRKEADVGKWSRAGSRRSQDQPRVFTTIPKGAKGRRSMWAGWPTLHRTARSRYSRRRGIEQRFLVTQAVKPPARWRITS